MILHRIITFKDEEMSAALERAPVKPALDRHAILVYIYESKGNLEAARVQFDSLRIAIEHNITSEKNIPPKSDFEHTYLGIAHAILGQKDEAIRNGRYATERFPLSQDALFGTITLEHLAEIYVRVGEYEAAIDQLETLMSVPSNISAGILALDPLWDPLRDNPRFQALVAADR